MRALTEEETQAVFEKLANFIGANLQQLVEREDDPHVFRMVKDRVYYVSERMTRLATNLERKALVAFGTCIGKFTKNDNFRIAITALDLLAQFALHKVWLKAGAEQSFLYGNHVTKARVGRVSDGITQNAGVVVYSVSDLPLGFGVAAQPTEYIGGLGGEATVCLHQADVGEYLRIEDELS